MAKNPLIVESPSEVKTLKEYLGGDFEILTSYGHVHDLIPKNSAVDPERDFAMKYELIKRSAKHVDAIIAGAKGARNIYLAADPDREGKAISWHLYEILKTKRGLKNIKSRRVVFREITKNTVLNAVANPCEIEMDLVGAQQAHRALDYLIDFNLSPSLWKKIRRGLSAGRAQNPASYLICERESEIRAFGTQEYWTVHLGSHKGHGKFIAKLAQYNGAKFEQFDLSNETAQADVLRELEGKEAVVTAIEKKRHGRNPAAPFTASTMQQDAVYKLGFATDRTMRTAQQLCKGINVGRGATGLITYMRTDSVNLVDKALTEIRHYIGNKIGKECLPSTTKQYKTKFKNAQEAHEVIRPTSVYRTPESIRPFLSADQFKLYQMIWQRTVACQMTLAKFDQTTVDITVGKDVFRITGQTQTFAGSLNVYEESSDDEEDEDSKKLPEMSEGDKLSVDKLYGRQHFTTPPLHYNKTTLVKALGGYDIGRPSTYASIISTLKNRECVTLEQKRFMPTNTGDIVNEFLTEHFAQYVDYRFTVGLEDQFDEIADGKRRWIPTIDKFWKPFIRQVEEEKGIKHTKFTTQELDETRPKCGEHKLQVKFGKMGRFIAYAGYPECSYTRNVSETAEETAERIAKAKAEQAELDGRGCPECDGRLVHKYSRTGSKFIGCTSYPECKHVEPLEKPKDTGVQYPQCKKDNLVECKSRYGRLFYNCNTYPDCNYTTWNPPVAEECPNCHWPVLAIKTTKRQGVEKVCPQKECGWEEQVRPPAPGE